MLIDTRSIINLTNLRLILGQIVDEVARKKKVFLVTDKGEIKAALAPVSYLDLNGQKQSEDLEKDIMDLQKGIDEEMRGRKVWNSTLLVKKIRKARAAKLKTW